MWRAVRERKGRRPGGLLAGWREKSERDDEGAESACPKPTYFREGERGKLWVNLSLRKLITPRRNADLNLGGGGSILIGSGDDRREECSEGGRRAPCSLRRNSLLNSLLKIRNANEGVLV